MAKNGLLNVTANNTFQVWLDRTNELVDLMGSDVITASVSGDTTGVSGTPRNATLIGTFSANTFIANTRLRADKIGTIPGSTDITLEAPTIVNTATRVAFQAFSSSVDPVIRINNDSVAWDVGFDNDSQSFVINTGVALERFKLTTTGNLTVSGNITAGTGGFVGNIAGNVTGNASTASSLATARNIQLSGDVTGSASFDGSTNITITTTIADDSHNHVISNIDGLQSALDLKANNSRTITGGTGIVGGGDSSANRTLSADFATQEQARTGSDTTKVMNPARTIDSIRENAIKGYIVFNGSTGAVIKSKNLTLAKAGTGNYSITCAASIQDGSSNWGVVITNVDDGVLSRTPIGINQTTVNNFQNNWLNAFATGFTSAGFTVRSKRTYSQWFSFLVGNDNGGGNTFGVEAIDPSYIALVVF